MNALIKRNLKLYFRNRVGAVMSLFGALIAFFIYIGFLKENLVQQWDGISHAKRILDAWMMGGILTITQVTTAFGALGQLVNDRESNRYRDFKITSVSQSKLGLSYFISTFLISFIMQIVALIVMAVYFQVTDGLTISFRQGIWLLLIAVLGTLVATIFCQIIVEFIPSHIVFNRMSAIIGTGIGFAIATYMPLGTLPKFGRHLVKVFPSSYIASSMRNVLIDNQIPQNIRSMLNEYLGVKIVISQHSLSLLQNLTLVAVMTFIGLGLLIFINKLKYKQY